MMQPDRSLELIKMYSSTKCLHIKLDLLILPVGALDNKPRPLTLCSDFNTIQRLGEALVYKLYLHLGLIDSGGGFDSELKR